ARRHNRSATIDARARVVSRNRGWNQQSAGTMPPTRRASATPSSGTPSNALLMRSGHRRAQAAPNPHTTLTPPALPLLLTLRSAGRPRRTHRVERAGQRRLQRDARVDERPFGGVHLRGAVLAIEDPHRAVPLDRGVDLLLRRAALAAEVRDRRARKVDHPPA